MKNNRFLLVMVLAAFFSWGVKAADMSNSLDVSQLYIIGDATPYQWDVKSCAAMTQIDEGVFSWTGRLEASKEFKFLNEREFQKHILGTMLDEQVTLGGTYDLTFANNKDLPKEQDYKFKINQTGEYTIYVDLRCMKMSVQPKAQTPTIPQRLFVSGSSVKGQTVEMTEYGGAEFKVTLELKAGELKLQDSPTSTSSTTYYVPFFSGVDVAFGQDHSSILKATHDASVEGWSVAVPGKYTIYLVKDEQTAFARFFVPKSKLYIVGGCCSTGWDLWADPSALLFRANASNPEELVWEGSLKTNWGEQREEPNKLKIVTAQSWDSETYHPYSADASILGSGSFRSTGGPDVKWTIPASGYYRITVNTANETIEGKLLHESANAKEGATTKVENVVQNIGVSILTEGKGIRVIAQQGPVDVRISTVGGVLVAQSKQVTDKIVARNLTTGIYIVHVNNSFGSVIRKVVVGD